jgi:hypothetical protein
MDVGAFRCARKNLPPSPRMRARPMAFQSDPGIRVCAIDSEVFNLN